MKELSYRRHPVSAGCHPACRVALLALHAQLPRRRGSPCRAWARHLVRNRPELGAQVRTGDCSSATTAASSPERQMAPRRDGGSDRRHADVSLARRRPRRRSPRHAGPAPPRQPGSAAADAQASQKARVCTEIAGTDKLRSYASAFRRLRLTCQHEQGLRKNNRAENSHQPIDAADLPSRGGERMAECSRSRVIAHPDPGSFDPDKLIWQRRITSGP